MTQQGVLSAQKLYVGAYDLTGNITAIAMESGVDGLDSTRYSTSLAGITSRTEDPGLASVRLEASSLFEAGAGTIDTVLDGYLRTRDVLVTFCPQTGTAGERAYLLPSATSRYRAGAPVGQMNRLDFSAMSTSRFAPGYVAYNGAVSVTASGSAFQFGAVGASAKLYGGIHVLSGAGSLTARIQSDNASNFPSAATQITFSAISAASYEWVTPVSGAITDDYWRADFTVSSGGPFSVVVVMGIL